MPAKKASDEEMADKAAAKAKWHAGVNAALARGKALQKLKADLKKPKPEYSESTLLLEDGSCDLTLGDVMQREGMSLQEAVKVMMAFRAEANGGSEAPVHPKAAGSFLPEWKKKSPSSRAATSSQKAPKESTEANEEEEEEAEAEEKPQPKSKVKAGKEAQAKQNAGKKRKRQRDEENEEQDEEEHEEEEPAQPRKKTSAKAAKAKEEKQQPAKPAKRKVVQPEEGLEEEEAEEPEATEAPAPKNKKDKKEKKQKGFASEALDPKAEMQELIHEIEVALAEPTLEEATASADPALSSPKRRVSVKGNPNKNTSAKPEKKNKDPQEAAPTKPEKKRPSSNKDLEVDEDSVPAKPQKKRATSNQDPEESLPAKPEKKREKINKDLEESVSAKPEKVRAAKNKDPGESLPACKPEKGWSN